MARPERVLSGGLYDSCLKLNMSRLLRQTTGWIPRKLCKVLHGTSTRLPSRLPEKGALVKNERATRNER
jgi:hypothetical protein